MAKKDKSDRMFEESSEDKLGRRDSKDDSMEDVLSDINKKRKEFYVDEETDKSVFHDNRYDSGNR
ncbi:hypothetical protein [Salinicoccus roseus]|jgi:hypothetical protein|uniref:Uncharacterized protein n=1 Tax=Salinicoccus roseus TaxID=45670 RepID=A0A265EB70_9STAP|nr:hypothetical protein [Salinicoccus roseus]MCG7332403.1 hypothetical protein [Salinicoccus roseus]OZT78528.1 hypothetical protein CFN03_04410 [Salinicoccus roseus]RPE54633.1 hypothetical protein EDC33_0889 [Salinicoccus roseus]GGA64105.1 hypothetical protein GCM10007176_05460 [Salinicoccus roseus]